MDTNHKEEKQSDTDSIASVSGINSGTISGSVRKSEKKSEQFEPGTMLKDRYKIDSVIGIGGFGVVYAAADTADNDKVVAIKTLKHNLSDYEQAAKRFEREIELCSQIESEHAVKITDSGAEGDILFYVMEYLEGYTLEDLIARHEKLSFYDLKFIYLQVLDALSEAHRKGIVHRDLKPANIWLTEKTVDSKDFDVKVLDFGIAKTINAGGEKLTQTGAWMGSPAYMSPEQLKGVDVSPASDIFALGLIAIEMLTGYQAVEGDSSMDIAMSIASDEPIYVDEWILESQIGAIVSKCVQKDPMARYANASSMAIALRALDDEELRNEYVAAKLKRRTLPRRAAITTMSSSIMAPPENKEKQLQTVIILAIVLCLVLLGIFLFVKFYVDKTVSLFGDKSVTLEKLSPRDAAFVTSTANGAYLGAAEDFRRAEVTISSQPPNATVLRASDGKELGKTPFTLKLIRSPLDYNARIHHDGFFDYPLTIKPRISSNIPITMNPIPEGFDFNNPPPGFKDKPKPSDNTKPDKADTKTAQDAADTKAAQDAANQNNPPAGSDNKDQQPDNSGSAKTSETNNAAAQNSGNSAATANSGKSSSSSKSSSSRSSSSKSSSSKSGSSGKTKPTTNTDWKIPEPTNTQPARNTQNQQKSSTTRRVVN